MSAEDVAGYRKEIDRQANIRLNAVLGIGGSGLEGWGPILKTLLPVAHAKSVVEDLAAGKNVFTSEELAVVTDAVAAYEPADGEVRPFADVGLPELQVKAAQVRCACSTCPHIISCRVAYSLTPV